MDLIAAMLAWAWAGGPYAVAQTNVGLNIQMYAGLSVTGEVGQVYQVQWASGLSETNTWYALQHFELKWNPHEFVDTTCPAREQRFYRAVEVEVPTNVVPVADMVFIPGGTFIMGRPPDEPAWGDAEGPQTEVTISRGFWMGTHEVTQGEYLAVVGSYFPNAWGLYDMHGNVWEWCQDWWSDSLAGGSVTDPTGPATGSFRVNRGSGWGDSADECRSAARFMDNPGDGYGVLGFRVVLAPGQP